MITIKLVLNGQWLIQQAASTVNKHAELKDIDAIFAFNDEMAKGSYTALQHSYPGNRIKIVGVDALPGKENGLEQIANGHITASMLYPAGGVEAIRTAVAILKKRPYKRENLLYTLVIDSNNVQLMRMQAEKIDSQQQDIDKQQALLKEQQSIYRSQQSALNILVISLVLAVVFAGIAIFALKSNWEKNKHLEQQNTEIRKQQQQLMEMNKRVKEASEAKSKFFTNISHEFKTPLTLILAPIEELLKEPQLSGEFREQLLRIKRNGLRLMNLASELIDIQRLAKEKIELKTTSQSIHKFIHQIILSFKPLSVQKNIPITYENKCTVTHLWFDVDLMEKVMYNLLSNAFKFTQGNGRIQIKVEQNTFGDYVIIRIIDNGQGIAKAHLKHIFDPFYQGAISTGGLGLALVKEIIELHHGQIIVSSKENESSSFALRLPVGDTHLSITEKAYVESKEQGRLVQEDPSLSVWSEKRDSSPIQQSDEPRQMSHRLLIVDDNEEILQFLNDKFKDQYHVYTATNVDGTKTDLLLCPEFNYQRHYDAG